MQIMLKKVVVDLAVAAARTKAKKSMKKIAFLFPGQGSQSVGMCGDFFNNSALAREFLSKANNTLGFDIGEIMASNLDGKLEDTKYTQPAILLVSAIATELFKQRSDIVPMFGLGHSLGEFSALVANGAISLENALYTVHKRGEWMQSDCEGGGAGMSVVLNVTDEKAEEVCSEARKQGKKVWCANYNSDGQIVLAGLKADLSTLEEPLKAAGAKRVMLLNMSVASHCDLLANASQKLATLLEDKLSESFAFPIVSNASGELYSDKTNAIELLKRQLIEPVLYKQSIKKFESQVDAFVEFGNGSVLSGLNKRLTDRPTYNVSDMASLEKTLESLA